MLTAEQIRSLPDFFSDIPDPRRAQSRRHRLPVVLGIAAGAILCGMRGYKAIAGWADDLGAKARERFGCRREQGRYLVASETIVRDVLVRVDSGSARPCAATVECGLWSGRLKPRYRWQDPVQCHRRT